VRRLRERDVRIELLGIILLRTPDESHEPMKVTVAGEIAVVGRPCKL
jgi:hypothetical protein